MAAMQVPRRQAEAEAPAAAPRRQAAAAAAETAPHAARRQAPEQPRGTVATSMASASASVVPPLIPLQKRRIRGISGVSSTESASPTEFPGPTVFDTDVDRQADSTVKQEEADLQEDLALADSLNTALPGRHEDDEEVAATQQDGEEDAVDEGEEEEELEEEEEEVATRQAQVAPPPQEGVVDQGEVIAACLRSQARARGQVYKGAPAIAAAALACVLSLISFSPRHARQCRCVLNCSLPTSFRARRIRAPVRQLALLLWIACALLRPLPQLEAGRPSEVVRVSPKLRQQGLCQTASPSFRCGFLAHVGHRTGTSHSIRPGARLDGSSWARLVSTWGYRGIRVGEASHPGPEGGEPPRLATIHRIPVGGNAPRSCSIRLTPQGGAWIWIVHSSPPLRVAGRKTPAEALQKWLQKFQEYILPDSQAVLRALHDQWQAHPIPPPPPPRPVPGTGPDRLHLPPVKLMRGF